jgi:hypothetical protein
LQRMVSYRNKRYNHFSWGAAGSFCTKPCPKALPEVVEDASCRA